MRSLWSSGLLPWLRSFVLGEWKYDLIKVTEKEGKKRNKQNVAAVVSENEVE